MSLTPLARPPRLTVTVPGSKSLTNRALVLAALGDPGPTRTLTGALASEDTEVMAESLRRLGFTVTADWKNARVAVSNPTGRVVPVSSADLYCANSGTSIRFLTALVALGHGAYRLDGVARMRERPIGDLLAALQALGVDGTSERGNGCPPVRVAASGLKGGAVTVATDTSSQFLSALLLAATRAEGPLTIHLTGPKVSEPYMAMTAELVRRFGGTVRETVAGYECEPGLTSHETAFAIEPDASAASYFWAAAAVTGGRVTVAGLGRGSLQGDVRFVDLLAEMGCLVEPDGDGLSVTGPMQLRGIDADMNAISDTAMTLAAVACFASGPTRIRNVAHVRHKETDRIAAMATELRRLGAGVEEHADGVTVTPRALTGCAVETYDDHRMAMSLALVGLRVPGVAIQNPGCVGKTYPGFWADFARLAGA